MLFILSQDILMLENIFWVCSYLSKKNKCYKSFSIFENYMTKIYSFIPNLSSFVIHNLKNFYHSYLCNRYIGLLLYFMSQTVSNTNRNNRKAKCHFIIFQFLVSCHALLPILKLFYELLCCFIPFILSITFYIPKRCNKIKYCHFLPLQKTISYTNWFTSQIRFETKVHW